MRLVNCYTLVTVWNTGIQMFLLELLHKQIWANLLWSSETPLLTVSPTRTALTQRASAVVPSTVWSTLSNCINMAKPSNDILTPPAPVNLQTIRHYINDELFDTALQKKLTSRTTTKTVRCICKIHCVNALSWTLTLECYCLLLLHMLLSSLHFSSKCDAIIK